MQSFRFPSSSKSRSHIKQNDYHQLADIDDVDYASNHDRREDLSRLRLVALTCSAGGLQIVFSLIMSNGTVRLSLCPYPRKVLTWTAIPHNSRTA